MTVFTSLWPSPRRERSLWTRPSRSLSLLAIRLSAYLFLSSSCFHSSSTLHSFGVGRHPDIKNILNPVAVAQLCHKYFHHQAESLLCPILHLGSPIIFKCTVMPSVFIRFVLTVHFSSFNCTYIYFCSSTIAATSNIRMFKRAGRHQRSLVAGAPAWSGDIYMSVMQYEKSCLRCKDAIT
ncbi:hypothetical protein ARMGADRAFT_233783 [Armillaria gallica]|uniref:Uncharacterized protein n=1 Tax=Armillaria gallica TaxID=47427 RepID=A0A2H3ETH6_ARMGA|nr:hypothetical protein ARMGADRAFT_233783 [Armillaria gallica]